MKVILNGDTATGYLDYDGVPVIGIVQATGPDKAEGKFIAKTGDNVHFPYHRQGVSLYGTLDIPLVGIGKGKSRGQALVLEGQVLSNGATLVASTSKLFSS